VQESEPNAVCRRERWCAGARGGVPAREVVCGRRRRLQDHTRRVEAAHRFAVSHTPSRRGTRVRTRVPCPHAVCQAGEARPTCVCGVPVAWPLRARVGDPYAAAGVAHGFQSGRTPVPDTTHEPELVCHVRTTCAGHRPCRPLTGAFGERIHRSVTFLATAETCRLSLDQTRAGERRRGAGGNRWWVPTGDRSVTGVTDEAVVAFSGGRGDVARSVSGRELRVSGMSSPLRNRDPESFERPCC